MTANTDAVMPSRICTAMSSDGSETKANNRPRIGSAAKPIRSSGRRPQICARLPIHGDRSATTSCGTTMQAAMIKVAQRADFIVTTLPTSGSMAALAR